MSLWYSFRFLWLFFIQEIVYLLAVQYQWVLSCEAAYQVIKAAIRYIQMFRLRTNIWWPTRHLHIKQRHAQPIFLKLLLWHLSPPPTVFFIWFFLQILCRKLQDHSNWCWSFLRDYHLEQTTKHCCYHILFSVYCNPFIKLSVWCFGMLLTTV